MPDDEKMDFLLFYAFYVLNVNRHDVLRITKFFSGKTDEIISLFFFFSNLSMKTDKTVRVLVASDAESKQVTLTRGENISNEWRNTRDRDRKAIYEKPTTELCQTVKTINR